MPDDKTITSEDIIIARVAPNRSKRFGSYWWLRITIACGSVALVLILILARQAANNANSVANKANDRNKDLETQLDELQAKALELQHQADVSQIETLCRSQKNADLGYARGLLDSAQVNFFIDLVDSLTDNDPSDDAADLATYQADRTKLRNLQTEVDRLAELQKTASVDCQDPSTTTTTLGES
jgi:hypothetical protein